MRYAFELTEQVESIPMNPAIWTGIQSEIEPLESPDEVGIGGFLRNLILPRRRLATAAGIALAIVVILFVSFPINRVDPALEEEFTAFIEEREKISRENRRILFENAQNGDYRGRNPFVKPVGHRSTNPFRK
jgi:hypothetical protein